ncbi:MAG: hypothetical protein AB1894_27130 [Chloroflexota bacterium]
MPIASQGVQAWDRFSAMNNNPVRFNDPTGHKIANCADYLSGCGEPGSSESHSWYVKRTDGEGISTSTTTTTIGGCPGIKCGELSGSLTVSTPPFPREPATYEYDPLGNKIEILKPTYLDAGFNLLQVVVDQLSFYVPVETSTVDARLTFVIYEDGTIEFNTLIVENNTSQPATAGYLFIISSSGPGPLSPNTANKFDVNLFLPAGRSGQFSVEYVTDLATLQETELTIIVVTEAGYSHTLTFSYAP